METPHFIVEPRAISYPCHDRPPQMRCYPAAARRSRPQPQVDQGPALAMPTIPRHPNLLGSCAAEALARVCATGSILSVNPWLEKPFELALRSPLSTRSRAITVFSTWIGAHLLYCATDKFPNIPRMRPGPGQALTQDGCQRSRCSRDSAAPAAVPAPAVTAGSDPLALSAH